MLREEGERDGWVWIDERIRQRASHYTDTDGSLKHSRPRHSSTASALDPRHPGLLDRDQPLEERPLLLLERAYLLSDIRLLRPDRRLLPLDRELLLQQLLQLGCGLSGPGSGQLEVGPCDDQAVVLTEDGSSTVRSRTGVGF